jgi:hypothetical protein
MPARLGQLLQNVILPVPGTRSGIFAEADHTEFLIYFVLFEKLEYKGAVKSMQDL